LTRAAPLLAARGAGRRFGHRSALEPVELEVWDGEAVALVGPNGAGKSTLLALLAGALEASVGTIERRKGARVGWAPQRPAQYGRLSARENLELFARLEGEHDPQGVTEGLLRDFDLPGEPEPSANLSVGNRQRLNLAIAQLGRPQVLLLDEPTAALDSEQRGRLWRRVADLRAGGGAIVFATQNLEEVDQVADRVAALREGRLVYTGAAGEYDRAHVETLSA
jgi:ABC-type multidrug transport system ATPase subunit